MGPATADWNQAIQDRLLGVSAIIAQVVGIKMLGLGQPMIDFVQRLREREIVVSKTARKIRIVMVTLRKLKLTVYSSSLSTDRS